MNNPITTREAMKLVSKVNLDTKIRRREKNFSFLKKYNITHELVIEYVKSLNEKHFVNRVVNKDKKINTDYLYEFYATANFNNQNGTEDIVPLYIKICELKNKEIICIVSFHDREL